MTNAALVNRNIRLQSLDNLRGLAIFGMIFAEFIPASMPRWMHHDQYMQGEKLIINLGLTWVDIVFPIFLFSLGMAIPFALAKRIEEKLPVWRLIGHIVWRTLIICGFGYFLGNAYGYPADSWMWIRTLIGFVCLVLFLARLSFIPDEKKWLKAMTKIVGFAGLLALMATVHHQNGSGFTTDKNDVIILIMSQVYLTSSLVWLVTRKNILLRLAVVAGIFALRLHSQEGGVIISTLDRWMAMAHLTWFYWFTIIYVSSVPIFGSILGDFVYEWSKTRQDFQGIELSKSKLTSLLVLLPMVTVGGLYFLQTRHIYWGLFYTIAMCFMINRLAKDAQTSMGSLVQRICKWSTFFLIVGYFLEPYEGGIKKDPATMAYYFVTTGMASSLFVFLFILVDDLKVQRGLGFLRIAGSNPMLAYITGGFLILPILHLTHLIKPIEKWSQRGPIEGMIWAVVITWFILFVVNQFTKRKIYLRV